MKAELANKLIEKYPKLFTVSEERRMMPFPMFGFEVGDGWYNIINQLCFQIQSHIDYRNSQRERLLESNPYNIKIPDEVPQIVVDQVKEKFGTLRFYTSGSDDRIDGLIRMAEAMSSVTCEVCGKPGEICGRSWYYTACEEHTKEGELVMNKSLPMTTINTTDGDPYISLIDEGETFSIQLHRYGRVVVTLDKRVIPEMIEHLQQLQKDNQ